MARVVVSDILKTKALVTRSSARVLGEALRQGMQSGDNEIVVDFNGVLAVTPSFVDELFRLVDDLRRGLPNPVRTLKLTNVPTRLSVGFAAIGRSHGTSITESAPNVWSSSWGQS